MFSGMLSGKSIFIVSFFSHWMASRSMGYNRVYADDGTSFYVDGAGYVDGRLFCDFSSYFDSPVIPHTDSWSRLLYRKGMSKTPWFACAKKLHRCPLISAEAAHGNILVFGTPYRADAFTILAAFKGTDPEKETDPPPAATPVQFPRHISIPTTKWDESNAPDLQQIFGSVLRPLHLSEKHVAALNIDIRTPSPLEDVVPRMADGASYIPSMEKNDSNIVQSYVAAARHDSLVTGKDKDLSDRLTELHFENDAAFRVVSRTPPKDGMKPPRLAYLRKFWEGLENMSQYWDCSLDRYYKSMAPESDRPKGHDDPLQNKKIRLDSLPATQVTPNPPSSPTPESQDVWNAKVEATLPVGTKRGEDGRTIIQEEVVPASALRYKGRRTSTGRDIPPAFLSTTVTAFAEAAVWPFQCTVMAPRKMPVIQLGRLNIPVKLTAGVYRMPNDRLRARQGWVEGPLMGVLCRPETSFAKTEGVGWDWNSGTDLLREISACLELAQERRREKQINKKPGEGQWWTQKPRWGGGSGGEVGSKDGNADVNDGIVTGVEESSGLKTYKKAPPVRKTPAMLWEELKCGNSVWDSKVVYEGVGRAPGTDEDEIFLLSSLNHHVSIVKLTVHDAYLDYLTHGTLPSPLPEDEEWSRPRLERSQWFDMFNVDQRVQAFLALWGLMAYLTRETNPELAGSQPENGS